MFVLCCYCGAHLWLGDGSLEDRGWRYGSPEYSGFDDGLIEDWGTEDGLFAECELGLGMVRLNIWA